MFFHVEWYLVITVLTYYIGCVTLNLQETKLLSLLAPQRHQMSNSEHNQTQRASGQWLKGDIRMNTQRVLGIPPSEAR